MYNENGYMLVHVFFYNSKSDKISSFMNFVLS